MKHTFHVSPVVPSILSLGKRGRECADARGRTPRRPFACSLQALLTMRSIVIGRCGDRNADPANSEPFLLFAQLDVGILDDLRPFGDVGVDDGSEFVW